MVVAPSLVLVKAGDRVETEDETQRSWRDIFRAGDLTAVWVPDAAHVETAPEEIREVIEALQALRGVAKITAATIVSKLGSIVRFASAKHLMGFSGLLSGEYSSGSRVRRGAVTKTGNAHLRRVIVEAAWAYQRRPRIGGCLAKGNVT
jgi:transposase